MWVRMLRLESRRLDEEADAEQPAEPEAASPDYTHSVADRAESAVVHDEEDDDPELAAYNRMLAELAARDQESTRRR
jgi:hypothetical protein